MNFGWIVVCLCCIREDFNRKIYKTKVEITYYHVGVPEWSNGLGLGGEKPLVFEVFAEDTQ